MNPLSRLLPPVVLTVVSAASMALEIVAGRLIAPYVGMSLYTWTIIIAVVLAGLSIGHWLGGIVSDRTDKRGLAVGLILLAASLFAAITLPALTFAQSISVQSGPIAHVSTLTIGAFFMPSLFAGMISPLLTTIALNASDPGRSGRVLGMMFALGAFGAIVGTLLAGLVMISWLGSSASVALIAVVYAFSALFFLGWLGRAGAALIVALLILAQTTAFGRSFTRLPCDVESAYYCIQVDDVVLFERSARVMALDHLAHGANDAADPRLLLTPYVHGVDELVRSRLSDDDLSAFFIGGGAFTLPRAWLDRFPDGRFVVSELDPKVTETAMGDMWLPNVQTLEVQHLDARLYLAKQPDDKKFDVIFGDAFHDITVPVHLVTDEFNTLVKQHLSDNGIYALNVVDLLRAPSLVLSMALTLERQFAHVELWLDVAEISPREKRTTWIVLASDAPTAATELRATYGFDRTWVNVPLSGMVNAVGAGKTLILTDNYAPIDRLLSPLLLDASVLEN